MHIIDIWLEELKLLAPSNLKNVAKTIAIRSAFTFRYLLIDWWWLSLILLFSLEIPLLISRSALLNPELIASLVNSLIVAGFGYYAFLATLAAFPVPGISSLEGLKERKQPFYFAGRQGLVWPVLAPFVLWIVLRPHIYKFVGLIAGRSVLNLAITISSFLLLNMDWYISPLFVFFAFLIIQTYAMHGIMHAFEQALGMVFYTYPVSVLVVLVLYVIYKGLFACIEFFASLNTGFAILFHPLVFLIPIAAVLFSAVYEWHMKNIEYE